MGNLTLILVVITKNIESLSGYFIFQRINSHNPELKIAEKFIQ